VKTSFEERMEVSSSDIPLTKEEGLVEIKKWYDSGKISKERYGNLFKGINAIKPNKNKIES
jgi:hypothetical protein